MPDTSGIPDPKTPPRGPDETRTSEEELRERQRPQADDDQPEAEPKDTGLPPGGPASVN